MTTAEAGQALAYLNAAFPRDALEPESAAVWVREIAELKNPEAALEAAKLIGRGSDRFPTIKEFRQAYRQAADRMKPRELDWQREEMPESVKAWMADRGITRADLARGTMRIVADIRETRSMPARPVWDRARRRQMETLGPPTDVERHDAILVLRESVGWGDSLSERMLVTEAQRIMDDCS